MKCILGVVIILGIITINPFAFPQDAEDLSDIADDVDTNSAQNLVNASRRNEYTQKGKDLGNSRKSAVISAGEKEPEFEEGKPMDFGRDYDQATQEEESKAFQTNRDTRKESGVEISPTILNNEKVVKNATLNLAVTNRNVEDTAQDNSSNTLSNTYVDCINLGTNSDGQGVNITTQVCETTAEYEEITFTCTRNGFDSCAQSGAGGRSMSILEAGVVLMGNTIRANHSDADNPYHVSEELGAFTEPPDDGTNCISSEFAYSVLVPDPGLIRSFELVLEEYSGKIEILVEGNSVAERGSIETCLSTSDATVQTASSENFNILELITSKVSSEDASNSISASISFRLVHPEFSLFSFRLDGYAQGACINKQVATYNCPEDISEDIRSRANLISEECIEEYSGEGGLLVDETQTICTKWQQDYEIVQGPFFIESEECMHNKTKGCLLIGTTCTGEVDELCTNYSHTFQCEEYQTLSDGDEVEFCGNNISCPGGDCAEEFQEVPSNEEDFKEASIWMEMLAGMDGDIDSSGGDFSFFDGKNMVCEKDFQVVDALDCCSDSGWVVEWGLGKCKSREIELAQAREANRVVYLGSKADTTLGFVTGRDYTYCVFDSPLARVFMQEAHKLLGSDFGSRSNPNCGGLDVHTMEGLNFDAMDFSELYPNAGKDVNVSDPDYPGVEKKITDSDPCSFSASGNCRDNE